MKINRVVQFGFNKVVETMSNSKASERANQRILNYANKIAENSHGEVADILIGSAKVAFEVPRSLLETLFELIKNAVTK